LGEKVRAEVFSPDFIEKITYNSLLHIILYISMVNGDWLWQMER
jgi:hypothetical protein